MHPHPASELCETPTMLDVEASGFGRHSYPIEIGFVLPDGHAFCTLIQPAPDWTHWDAAAEQVHHITRALLLRRGRPALEVAHLLNERLDGLVVYSDGWANDYTWLAILFDAAGMAPSFKLENIRRLLAEDEAERLFEQSFEAWFQEALQRPPEGVRRVLRRRSKGREGRGARDLLRDAAWKLCGHRDFTAAWRRDPFDRDAGIDAVITRLRGLAPLGARAERSGDFLAESFKKIERFLAELDRRELIRPRDHDGLEAELGELGRWKEWSWKGGGPRYGKGLLRADILAERDAVRLDLERFLELAGADLAEQPLERLVRGLQVGPVDAQRGLHARPVLAPYHRERRRFAPRDGDGSGRLRGRRGHRRHPVLDRTVPPRLGRLLGGRGAVDRRDEREDPRKDGLHDPARARRRARRRRSRPGPAAPSGEIARKRGRGGPRSRTRGRPRP